MSKSIPTPPSNATILYTNEQGRVMAIYEPPAHQFGAGNQAASKQKWSANRLQKFAGELKAFRELIGFNYSEMGRALGVSGQYIKLIERAERQPSLKLVHLFRKLKATPVLTGERISSESLKHLAEIWTHILARRFKCPECAREVRRGERHKGLEFWYAAAPNQKYCPTHTPNQRKHVLKGNRQRKHP